MMSWPFWLRWGANDECCENECRLAPTPLAPPDARDCKETGTQRKSRLPSPQGGRGVGGEGEFRNVDLCLLLHVWRAFSGFSSEEPLRATPPHPLPLSPLGRGEPKFSSFSWIQWSCGWSSTFKRCRVISAMCMTLLLLLVQAVSGQVSYERIRRAESEPGNWLTYSGNYQSHRHSLLAQINPGNVARLKPAWVYQIRNAGEVETSPIVLDGVLYITEKPNVVTALDGKTGRPLWSYRRRPSNRRSRLLRASEPWPCDSGRPAIPGHL